MASLFERLEAELAGAISCGVTGCGLEGEWLVIYRDVCTGGQPVNARDLVICDPHAELLGEYTGKDRECAACGAKLGDGGMAHVIARVVSLRR